MDHPMRFFLLPCDGNCLPQVYRSNSVNIYIYLLHNLAFNYGNVNNTQILAIREILLKIFLFDISKFLLLLHRLQNTYLTLGTKSK